MEWGSMATAGGGRLGSLRIAHGTVRILSRRGSMSLWIKPVNGLAEAPKGEEDLWRVEKVSCATARDQHLRGKRQAGLGLT